MKVLQALRAVRALLSTSLLCGLLIQGGVPLSAQAPVTQNPKPQGVRSGNGQTLHASVTVDGTASKALVAVWSSTGALVASGTSTSLGTYVKQLTAGTYTITATTAKGSASASVTIVASTSPAIVPLAITSTP